MSRKLRGEFTFGFEFEGFARLSTYLRGTGVCDNYDCDFDEMECNSLDGDDYEEFYDRVNDFINHKLHAKKGRTHYDGSVKNYMDGYQSFEYSSTVYKFNAKNLKLLKNFFNRLPSYEMGVNSTCGFHTHISYKGITEKDAIWIVSQIACNPEWTKEVCQFNYDDNTNLNFYNQRYANKDFLKEIKEMVENGNYRNIKSVINSDKYRVLRIHPQGTIEWRGPRDFLSLTYGFNRFVKKLAKIIDIFSMALSKTDLMGISKKEFFDNLYNSIIIRINGCELNPKTNKTILRHGLIGYAADFNYKDIYSSMSLLNLDKIKNIAKNSEKNAKILCNKDLEEFSNALFATITYKTAVNYINSCKTLKHDIPANVINTMLAYHSVLLPDLIDYIKKPSLEEIARYADKINFDNIVDNEKINKFVKTCLNSASKDEIIDISMLLFNSSYKVLDAIFDCMKNGLFKDVDSTRIYFKYVLYAAKHVLNIKKQHFDELRNSGLIMFNENSDKFDKNALISELISSIDNLITTNNITIDTTPRYSQPEERDCSIDAPRFVPISYSLETSFNEH